MRERSPAGPLLELLVYRNTRGSRCMIHDDDDDVSMGEAWFEGTAERMCLCVHKTYPIYTNPVKSKPKSKRVMTASLNHSENIEHYV